MKLVTTISSHSHNLPKLALPLYGLISLLLLLLFIISFLIINPVLSTTAEATPVQSIHQTDLSVNVAPVISLGITNCDSSQTNYEHITIEAKATTNGGFSSDCQNLTISTNTPGYSLEARAVSSNNTNNLVHTTNSSLFIPSVPAPDPPVNPDDPYYPFSNATALTTNQWGFAMIADPTNPSLDTTNQPIAYFDSSYAKNDSTNKYANLPTTDTELYRRDQQPTAIDNFQAYYATKIDITQPAGYYQTTITYTVTGEEILEPIIYAKVVDGASFQDTTLRQSESCGALTVGTIVTMKDNRNNQNYRVKKMADDKCWMIDNLKLELTPGMELNPATSNVAENTTVYFTEDGTEYGVPLEGMTGDFTTSGYMTRDNTITTTSPNQDAWRQADAGTTNACLTNTGGNAYAGNLVYDAGSITKCGYLYNYYTATASTGAQTKLTTDGARASGSICPSGWRLPSLYSATDGPGPGKSYNYGDFPFLNARMNDPLASLGVGTGSGDFPKNWYPNGVWQGNLSGRYVSAIDASGRGGLYWSSTVNGGNANAYDVYFHEVGGVYLGGGYPGHGLFQRYTGMAVRCVVGE